MISYEIRQRLIVKPEPEDDPQFLHKMQPFSFKEFVKSQGFLPDQLLQRDYDELEVMKEELKEDREPQKDIVDHKEDVTTFEVSIVNRANQCVNIDCRAHNGTIELGKVRIFEEQGWQRAREHYFDRSDVRLAKKCQYPGPSYAQLPESVQSGIMDLLYEAGVRPEVALVVEYLSWNKEQRLYMKWLRDMGLLLTPPPQPQSSQSLMDQFFKDTSQ